MLIDSMMTVAEILTNKKHAKDAERYFSPLLLKKTILRKEYFSSHASRKDVDDEYEKLMREFEQNKTPYSLDI